MTLMLIACDRFFGIVYAMKAHIIERKALPSLLIVWFVSAAIGVPMFLKRQEFRRQWKGYLEKWCDDNWQTTDYDGNVVLDRKSRAAYYTCVTILLYFIPLVVMSCAYGGVIKTLWASKAPGERLSQDVKVQTRVKQKVVIMLILIMVVFGVCWLPLEITILYSEFKDPAQQLGPWYEDFQFAAKTLAYFNCALNPLIYAGFNDNFRKGFRLMFGCYKKQRYTTLSKTEDSFHSSATVSTGMTRM
ncbi:hypothetical protein FSP39_003037 [Pinctada imbricata]|uniref:G-protein coupled receptors family 1 profile domain-containing protein n=1 Tax=Pinctada imbricata TaxID=66713 RepID=A0AA88XWT2_PINIB|nr:hypothetical protein FSP39_003037 [Pinctada imbricata]